MARTTPFSRHNLGNAVPLTWFGPSLGRSDTCLVSVCHRYVAREARSEGMDYSNRWRSSMLNSYSVPCIWCSILFESEMKTEPNKAIELTPGSVTISAAQKVTPLTSVAHL
jgi:hypothetical protein